MALPAQDHQLMVPDPTAEHSNLRVKLTPFCLQTSQAHSLGALTIRLFNTLTASFTYTSESISQRQTLFLLL